MRVPSCGSGPECVGRISDLVSRLDASHPRLDSFLFSGPIRQKRVEVLLASVGPRSARRRTEKSPGLSIPNTLRR